jgi:hypothetical protein
VWTETGLASPAITRGMARLSLPGIDNAQGARAFLRELARGTTNEPWALLSPRATLEYALGAPRFRASQVGRAHARA